jgi:K+-transporting ATPase ATPase A chain
MPSPKPVALQTQTLAMGPVASQEAIKMLGTNGGGFINANSAHPFENPTPLSNFFQMLSIFLIPAALCVAFGRMVGDPARAGRVLAAMTVLFVIAAIAAMASSSRAIRCSPRWAPTSPPAHCQPGGNMEGKEARFGIADSGAVRRHHHRRLLRRGQCHARLVHAAGGRFRWC